MKTGILVPPCDPRAVEETVRLLLSDEKLHQRLGRAARERIKKAHLPVHYAHDVAQALGIPSIAMRNRGVPRARQGNEQLLRV